MLLGNLRLVVAVLTAVTVAALASEARPDSPTEETWHAYLELRLSAGARSAYLFKALGPLGRTFTENCLDTEVGVYVEMATCVQEGDALGKECLNASNALRQELNAQLREIGAASPTTNLSVDVECRSSRVAYEFTALPPLAEVARDLHAGALPATGVVVNRDTVLDGHFYNWILHPCDTRKKMKRNELCVPTVQKFTARGGKGPYLSKKERSDRLAHAAGAAEAARVQSVESSSRITGAFGLEFGKAVALPWEAAEINAMINLPPSPEVFNYERRGWVMFAPLSVPQAFADLHANKVPRAADACCGGRGTRPHQHLVQWEAGWRLREVQGRDRRSTGFEVRSAFRAVDVHRCRQADPHEVRARRLDLLDLLH